MAADDLMMQGTRPSEDNHDIDLAITWTGIYTFKPRQNDCHFPDNVFKCIFLNENL